MKTRELKRILDGASNDWELRGPGFCRELFDGADAVVTFHRHNDEDIDGEEIAYMTARIEGDREFAFGGQYRSLSEIDSAVSWWLGRYLVDVAYEATGMVPEYLASGEWLQGDADLIANVCGDRLDDHDVIEGVSERLYELRIATADFA